MLGAKFIDDAIHHVSAQPPHLAQAAFLQRLLVDTLQWPIDPAAKTVEETAFQWTTDELKAGDLSQKLVANRVWQIQTNPAAPWGIFLLEFKNPDAFLTDRRGGGMTGPLRTILRTLVPKARANPAHRPVWKREHLLFICTHEYKHFRFAYFKAPEGQTKTAPLAAFGWSPDVPARTACEHNLPHLQWPEKFSADAFHEKWADAFNVEKVTKHFYEDYHKIFALTETAIGDAKGNNLKGEDLRLFTQSLFNRLMFLRFIERKGWLRFPSSQISNPQISNSPLTPADSVGAGPTGAPPTNYLAHLYQAGPIAKQSFYNARLKPLFFQGLAKEHDKQKPSPIFGDVPFLNGGLFESGDLDAKVADIPDSVFTKILHPEVGLFYRYNFTVEESTPLDIEVAVDPEMLGKVFEELVTGRHESGSYFTPRPVVSFMCREALKGYLASATKAPESAIAALVDAHEVQGLTDSHARQIIAALDHLKAVDPACGSGAYLLGLLHELLAIYRVLYSEKLLRDSRSLYELKLRIISHNLYGVDIDPFATSIAMLRLWLSLAVDSDDPIALPNLEFKIETGDSVCGPNPQPPKMDSGTADIFDARLASLADDLVSFKEDYLTAHGTKKAELKQIIQKQETEIAHDLRLLRAKGIIMWRVQFAEAFSKRGGFDIVLANPPYVRQELISDMKQALKKIYPEQYSGTADLYVFFYLRAIQLLRQGGMLVFISSNKWFRAGYGEKLRSLFATETCVRIILDFHDLPVFESAIAYPMIFITSKERPTKSHTATLAEPPSLDPPYPDVKAVVAIFGKSLPTTALDSNGAWHLASASTADRLAKMRKTRQTLGQYVDGKIYRGVVTGFNKAFVIDDSTRAALIKSDKRSCEIIKPLLMGKDLKRWRTDERGLWLIYSPWEIKIDEFPAIRRHLTAFRSELEARPECKAGRFPWWSLSRYGSEYVEEFQKPKIVYPVITERSTFAFDQSSAFCNDKGFIIASEDFFLLAVLNSSLFWEYVKGVCSPLQGGFYEMRRISIEPFPIPDASLAARAVIAALAQKCLDAQGVNCQAWEHEIDARVAALYGIDPADLVPAPQRPA